MPTDPTPKQRDERIALPLDPETALRALLKVEPDAEPADDGRDEGAEPSERPTPGT